MCQGLYRILSFLRVKSKSRLDFNDGRSWPLDQNLLRNGECTQLPAPNPVPYLLLSSPSGSEKPKVGGVLPLTAPLLTGHLCSLFRHSQANPSSCLPNLHTKGQCKATNYVYTRAHSFTPCLLPFFPPSNAILDTLAQILVQIVLFTDGMFSPCHLFQMDGLNGIVYDVTYSSKLPFLVFCLIYCFVVIIC